MEPSPIRRLEQRLNLNLEIIEQRLEIIENNIKITTLISPKHIAKDANDDEIILNEDNGQSLNKEAEYAAERLLNCDTMDISDEKIEPPPEYANPVYDMDEQYVDLLMIFPEADPVYLREVAEEIYSDPEGIKEFVQSKLENPDYPMAMEQQKQYTTDFKVQQFLEIFPDPFLHFEDNKRECEFIEHAVHFLKFYFNKLTIKTLMKAYYGHYFNLSLAANALEALNNELKYERRYDKLYQTTKNVSFLQECAFVQHKAELRNYIDNVKPQEMQQFNELKARNELLECQCCYDNECMPSKCSACQDGHIFCNSCVAQAADIVLRKGNASVDCLLQCGYEFPMDVLQKVLLPTKFNSLFDNRREEGLTTTYKGISCPHCYFKFIPSFMDEIFVCPNLNCLRRISLIFVMKQFQK